MPNPERENESPKFTPGDEIDAVLAHANPNPDRVGCPSRDVLVALAQRALPIEHPGYQHLARCSPCYREARALQQAAQRPFYASAAGRWAAAAAAVLIALVGAWLILRRSDPTPERAAQPPPPVAAGQAAKLDLRPHAVTRSDKQKVEAEPPVVPRGRLNATMLLPVGSAPGQYEVRILDQDLRVQATASGSAEIRNYITTLETTIDVSALSAGDYQLALRRDGGEWQMFPLRIR